MRRFPITFAMHPSVPLGPCDRNLLVDIKSATSEPLETVIKPVPASSDSDHKSALDEFSDHGQALPLHLLDRGIGLGGQALDCFSNGARSIAGDEEFGDQRLHIDVEWEAVDEAERQCLRVPLSRMLFANLLQANVRG